MELPRKQTQTPRPRARQHPDVRVKPLGIESDWSVRKGGMSMAFAVNISVLPGLRCVAESGRLNTYLAHVLLREILNRGLIVVSWIGAIIHAQARLLQSERVATFSQR